MQTPGEVYLIKKVQETLRKTDSKDVQKIVDIGAGKSLVIIKNIVSDDYNFVCDRVDISDCTVQHPNVGKCIVSSAESMEDFKSEDYTLGFSNYVLEHIPNLKKAAKEINRILKPGALYIASIPNPAAPEFMLADHSPLRFHQWIKGKGAGKEAYETYYNYKNTKELIQIFKDNGFSHVETKLYAFTYGYLYRFPILNLISKAYDKLVMKLGIKRLMGNICIVFKKN